MWDTTKHFFLNDAFVLTTAKLRAKSPITQKASEKKESLVVTHPVTLRSSQIRAILPVLNGMLLQGQINGADYRY